MAEFLEFPTFQHFHSITHGGGEFDWPSVSIRYENGAEDARATASRGQHTDVTVDLVLHQEDFAVLGEFIRSIKVRVTKFYYRHPDIGRALVRLAAPMKWKIATRGNPTWYAVSLVMREQLYGD